MSTRNNKIFFFIIFGFLFFPINLLGQSNTSQTFEVRIENFRFVPNTLEINVGDQVIFTWSTGADGHNVAEVDSSSDTSYEEGFYSGAPENAPATWNLPKTFTSKNSTLYYICEPHVISHSMRGKIIVGTGSPSDSNSNAALFWGIIIGTTLLLGAGFVFLVRKNQSAV